MSYAKTSDDDDRKYGKDNGNTGVFRGRKVCRLCADSTVVADYKNPSMLRNYLTDRGKLTPARVTGNCAKHQRALATAVRRARMIALMPFTITGN